MQISNNQYREISLDKLTLTICQLTSIKNTIINHLKLNNKYTNLSFIFTNVYYDMEASEPKSVNSEYIFYGVNTLRLGRLHII